jgi:mannitol-specific phosphotransferase system IIBC component
MKKVFLVVGLVMGLAVFAYAENASEVAKQITTELQNSGTIAAADAPSVSSSVKTLVESGASADEAKNVVAQAAHQAKAQGLKGKDLAAKVHEAVKARKAQLEEAKNKAKEAKNKAKEAEKKAREETKKAGRIQEKGGKRR